MSNQIRKSIGNNSSNKRKNKKWVLRASSRFFFSSAERKKNKALSHSHFCRALRHRRRKKNKQRVVLFFFSLSTDARGASRRPASYSFFHGEAVGWAPSQIVGPNLIRFYRSREAAARSCRTAFWRFAFVRRLGCLFLVIHFFFCKEPAHSRAARERQSNRVRQRKIDKEKGRM